MMKLLPTLSHVYSLLLQEESQLDCHISVVIPENSVMNVRFFANKFKNFNSGNESTGKRFSTTNSASASYICL